MADTADHLSPEPVLTDTIATPLEGADLQAVQATMSMVTGEVSDGSTDTESSLQASAPATSLPAIPENPDDLLSTPQAKTAQLGQSRHPTCHTQRPKCNINLGFQPSQTLKLASTSFPQPRV